MGLAAAMAIAGFGLNAFSQIQQGKAEARNARQQKALKLLSREEVLRRSERNSEAIRIEGERLKSAQVVEFFRGGLVSLEGAPAGVLLRTERSIIREIEDTRLEAEFQADVLQREARILEQRADEAEEAGVLGALSSVLNLGFAAAGSSGGGGGNFSLFGGG